MASKMATPQYKLVRNNGSTPDKAVQLAEQSDEYGKVWTAVAHTEWGDIPGKASGGTCWYSYDMKEYYTQDFSFLVSSKSELVLLLSDRTGPPAGAVKIGHQNDGVGDLFAAVAVSDKYGTVPGKAKDNTCWFPYGGKEYNTDVFYWVVTMFRLQEKDSGVPSGAVKMAWQTNSEEGLYSAVAHTTWGDIPGKAKSGKCWYAYDGKEHIADKFSYVDVIPCGAALSKNILGPPSAALRTGYQNDGTGDVYAAVAIHAQWGTIPGKAKGNQCWFSYDDREHLTSEFYWVVSLCDCVLIKHVERELTSVRVKRATNETELVRRVCDPQTTYIMAARRGNIENATLLHIREASTDLIARWTADTADASRSGSTIDKVGDGGRTVRMDNQGDFTDNGIRYANIQIQVRGSTVAAVAIQIGINFGRRFIRHALILSLRSQQMIILRRIGSSQNASKHDEL